jgi:UDP-glucose 4-epimerase
VRVLVTGAFGFVGTALVRRLAASGHEVRALTSGTSGGPGPAGAAEVVRGDVRDPEAMRSAVRDVDGVCHLAALTGVRAARDRAAEYWSVNHGGAATVVRAAMAEARRGSRPLRFVLASSGAVYGQPELQPIPEDLPLPATNDYGETKRAAELEVLEPEPDGRFGGVALRLFNAAGATGGRGGDPDTLIPKALAVARGAAPQLEINGDGTAVRDFVHVEDVARAFELALAHAEPDRRAVFNIGATGASVLDVVRTAREVTGHPIPVVHGPSRGEARLLLADTRRARAALGWQPQCSDLHRIVTDAWQVLAPPAG